MTHGATLTLSLLMLPSSSGYKRALSLSGLHRLQLLPVGLQTWHISNRTVDFPHRAQPLLSLEMASPYTQCLLQEIQQPSLVHFFSSYPPAVHQ